MDLMQFNLKYGIQATEELIDLVIISGDYLPSKIWKEFCLRHKIITPRTQKFSSRNYAWETKIYLTDMRIKTNKVFEIELHNSKRIFYLKFTESHIEALRQSNQTQEAI